MGESKRRKKFIPATDTSFAFVYFALDKFPSGFIAIHGTDEKTAEYVRTGQEDRSSAENRADYRWNIKPMLGTFNPMPGTAEIANTLQPCVEAVLTKLTEGERWECIVCHKKPDRYPAFIVMVLIIATHPNTKKQGSRLISSFVCKGCRAAQPHEELKKKVRALHEADITLAYPV